MNSQIRVMLEKLEGSNGVGVAEELTKKTNRGIDNSTSKYCKFDQVVIRSN